jgi:hypothetical protein
VRPPRFAPRAARPNSASRPAPLAATSSSTDRHAAPAGRVGGIVRWRGR